jgi:nitrous oxide reductase accessory protein NosL
MRKRSLLILALVSVIFWGASAAAADMDDVKQHPGCKYCGMNRDNFAYSRMLLEYEDGTQVGVCSLNCAAIDYVRDIDNAPRSIKVGDYKTKELVEAEQAYWVLGGDERGVMSERAKWAFKDERDARAYIKEHGGEQASFDTVMRASFEDILKDMRQTWQYRSTPRSCCKQAKAAAPGQQ